MSDWKEYKLGDICTILGRIGFRGYTKDDFVQRPEDGAIALSPSNIIDGVIDTAKVAYISWEKYKESPEIMLQIGDVVLSKTGTIGRTAIVRDLPHPITLNPQLVVLKNIKINNYFLSYLLKTPYFQGLLYSITVGSVVSTLSQKNLSNLMIMAPGKEEQERIVFILKTLDDKIECNRRINKNLEQQAQALFKSWFVDFEPFKDQPFVESELGMIPHGWRAGKLGELCQFKRGKGLLSKDAIPGDVPVVAGGLEPSCYHNVSNTKSPVVTVSGSGANAGFMRMYYQEVWASDCSFIDSTCENLFFVYCFLAINRRLLKHAQTGAVQPHVKPADIHEFDLTIPPKDVIDRFQNIVSETFLMRGNIANESRRLAELRDTLLPRLMSGELKVNDVI